jgi:transposase
MNAAILESPPTDVVDDGWRIPNPLWERIEPLLPKRRHHRNGGRPPLPWRPVLDGIFFVLRTGCQWKAVPKAFGSGSSLHRYCGRPSCRCHHGGPLHNAHHLTFKENGKTRSVYVPKELLPEVQSWLAEHKRLKQLLHEIHLLSVALRAKARYLKFKAGRH